MKKQLNLAKTATIISLIASLMSIVWIGYNAWITYLSNKAKKLGETNEKATDKV